MRLGTFVQPLSCLFLPRFCPAAEVRKAPIRLSKWTICALLFLIGLGQVVFAQTNTLILPTGSESVPGNTFADPFFAPDPPWVAQTYSAGAFAGAPDVLRIT